MVKAKEIIHTSKAPLPMSSVSQAVRYDNIVYVSGVVPLELGTGKVLFPNQMEKQTLLVLEYISEILKGAGTSIDHVLKINTYLNNINHFNEYDTAYARFFSAMPPARCTIGIGKFPLEGVCIEIDCIAYVPHVL